MLFPLCASTFMSWAKKKNICVFGLPTDPNFLAPILNFFMARLVENYLCDFIGPMK